MRKVLVPAVFCIFPLFVPSVAAAQDAAPAASGPVIRTTVSEVALDLVVRDNRGRVVKTLQPSDVEVYENGVKQEVKSFRLVAGADAEAAAGQKGAGGAANPMMPLRAVNLVCIVFHDMTNATKRNTMAAAQEFLSNKFPPDTYIGVFSLSGTLTPLLGFTENHNEVMQAARNAFVGHSEDFASAANTVLNASPNSVSVSGAGAGGVGAMNVSGGSINTLAVTGADVATGQAADAMRGDLADERRQFNSIHGAQNMDEMKTMIDMLGQLPGRKTVVLFSPGLTQTGDPDKLKDLQNRANKAHMTIYALGTLGITENSNALASGNLLGRASNLSSRQSAATASAGDSMQTMQQDDIVHDAVRTSNPDAPLRAISEATGGFFVSGGDLRKSYAKIVEDVDTHYEVIYHPSTDHYDGRFHKVEVKLAKADMNVESRQGYFALPGEGGAAPAPYENAALAAINSETKPHVFDFHAAAYQFRPEKGASQCALAFEIPAATLASTPVPQQGKQRLHVALLALVKDANGGVVDKISQDFPYEFTDDQLKQARTDSIRYTRPLSLPPGHYTVETAVLDRESNKTSTDASEFDVPGQKGLGMSSVVLVGSVQPLKSPADAANPFEFNDRRIVPAIDTDLKPGAQPYIYFVVYPDKANAEKPKIQVEVLHDGESVAKQTADLPAPDASGAIPMLVGTPPLPGKDEVKITAMQGDESAEHSLKYVAPKKEEAAPQGGQQ